jgi:hypothetical protein
MQFRRPSTFARAVVAICFAITTANRLIDARADGRLGRACARAVGRSALCSNREITEKVRRTLRATKAATHLTDAAGYSG